MECIYVCGPAPSADALVASGSLSTFFSEHYEEVGSLYEAVDFYERGGFMDALARLLPKAQDAGNGFLFRRICRILGHEPVPEEWLALAKRAEELGKLTFAAEAYRLGGVVDSPGEANA